MSSEAVPSAASQAEVSASFVFQGGSLHDLGHDAAVASPVRSPWFDESVIVLVSSSCAEPALRESAEPAHRVSFADVPSLDDDDFASIVSEKTLLSEGLRSVLRLLFQLCPSAAVEPPPPPQRTCDFEGLFGSAPRPVAGEVPMNLFHWVAELLSEAHLRFKMALDAGKLPAAGLPPRRRGPGSCAEPQLRFAAPFISSLYRLVGSLPSKRSINLSVRRGS